MSEELKGFQQQLNNLRNVMGEFQNIDKITSLTQDILPKDKFTANIDGHIVDISIGLSGQCIMFQFADKNKCETLFRELQQQKQGLFARIFRK